MKILEGLNQYQAVKFNNGYVVQLAQGDRYNLEIHTVNNTETKSSQVFVNDLDSIRKVNIPVKTIQHYLTSEGVEISVEEVESIRALSNPYYSEYEDEYIYPNLEVEFEIKKKQEVLKGITPVYDDPVKTFTEVDIEVVGVQEDTGSDFITTPYSIGKAFYDNEGGIYKVAVSSDIAKDEMSKLRKSYSDDDFKLPSHSGLRYVQVNNKYVFSDRDPHLDKGYSKVFTDLTEAKKYEETIRKFVRDKVLPHIKSYQEVTDSERSDIVDSLNGIEGLILKTQVKVKSESVKRQCLTRIRELLSKLGEPS